MKVLALLYTWDRTSAGERLYLGGISLALGSVSEGNQGITFLYMSVSLIGFVLYQRLSLRGAICHASFLAVPFFEFYVPCVKLTLGETSSRLRSARVSPRHTCMLDDKVENSLFMSSSKLRETINGVALHQIKNGGQPLNLNLIISPELCHIPSTSKQRGKGSG